MIILLSYNYSWVNLIQGLNETLSWFISFISTLFACFCAIFLFWLIMERSETNLSLWSRVKNERLNYLAIIRRQVRSYREKNMPDDEIYDILNKGYEKHALPFMHKDVSSDKKYAQNMEFVGRVIADKNILFNIVAAVDFEKKKYKDICNLLDTDEKIKEAYYAVKSIIKDNNQTNVDFAMKWLPLLFIPNNFILDPKDPDRKISKLENHFSIIFYLKGSYFKDNLEQQKFLICLKKLKRIHPDMEFAASISHSSQYIATLSKSDKRRDAIIQFIKSIEMESV